MAPLEYGPGPCEASVAEGKERFDRSYSERRKYEPRVFRFQESWMMKSRRANGGHRFCLGLSHFCFSIDKRLSKIIAVAKSADEPRARSGEEIQ